jgi:RNA polymerase sigma factor (sigma-70 family)
VSSTARAYGASADAEFEAIFLEHYEGVLRILMRLVGSGQAEELANEVFFRLSRQPVRWLVTSNVAGWLYRTAINVGIDALRSAAHRRRYEQAAAREGEQGEAGPLQQVLRDEDRRKVQRVLSAMKPAQAQILLMRAGGASYKEIAGALDVAVGGVGTLLNRAEAEFRKRYLKISGGSQS